MPCPLCPESRQVIASQRNDEKGQSTKSLRDSSLRRAACLRVRSLDWRSSIDAGCPVLRIEVSSTSSKTGVSYEYRFHQPAAPAHDRGHERSQTLCCYAEGPHPQLQTVCCFPEAFSRHGYGGGHPPVPTAPS